jgi:hypothetical protein
MLPLLMIGDTVHGLSVGIFVEGDKEEKLSHGLF